MAKRKPRISTSLPTIDSVTFKHFNELQKNQEKIEPHDEDLGFCTIKICDLPMQKTAYCEDLPMIYAVEYDSIYDLIDAGQIDEAIEGLQKLIKKVPYVPLVYIELQSLFHSQKRYEEATQSIIESYSKFKGLPLIDLIYTKTLGPEQSDFIANEMYKGSINLHEVYPHKKHFLTKEAIDFYIVLTTTYLDIKQYDKAELCLNALSKYYPNGDDTIRLRARFLRMKFPIKSYSSLILIILAILGVITLILWGIYKFFAWIF